MAKVTNRELAELLRERRGVDPSSIDFLAIDDHADAIRNDVDFLRSSPYLPADLDVCGMLYDVRSGRLAPVDELDD